MCGFDEGMYVNVGPWRIPYTHTGVLGYCREVGVPVELFINEAENSYFFYEGEQSGAMAGKRLRLREVKADMLGHVNELLVKAIDQNKLDMPMTAEDRDRFVKFLVSEGYLDATTKTYKAIGESGTPGVRHERAAEGGHRQPLAGRCRSPTAPRQRRSSSRSAAWTSSRRASRAPSAPRRISLGMEVISVTAGRVGREGCGPRYEDGEEERTHG